MAAWTAVGERFGERGLGLPVRLRTDRAQAGFGPGRPDQVQHRRRLLRLLDLACGEHADEFGHVLVVATAFHALLGQWRENGGMDDVMVMAE
jgi:hypothetical protein